MASWLASPRPTAEVGDAWCWLARHLRRSARTYRRLAELALRRGDWDQASRFEERAASCEHRAAEITAQRTVPGPQPIAPLAEEQPAPVSRAPGRALGNRRPPLAYRAERGAGSL